jgi:hypothetical protein
MSGRTHMQTTLARITQPLREAGHLFALAAQTLEPCRSSSTPSPGCKSFAGRRAEDDADHRRAWFTHSLLLQPGAWRAATNGSIAARSQRRPCGDDFQQWISIERHLSRIFPAHPRSLARCFSRARRHSAFCFALTGALRVWVSKEKISLRLRPLTGRDFFFGASAERHAFGTWERGTLASLRAGVSRGQSGANPNRRKDHGTL